MATTTEKRPDMEDAAPLPPVFPPEEAEDYDESEPFYDDGEDVDEDDGEVGPAEIAEAKPKPRGRRRRRSGRDAKTGEKRGVASYPGLAAGREAADMTYEEWVHAVEKEVGWAQPNLTVELERTQPTWRRDGQPVGGILAKQYGAPFDQEDVRERWGGGQFKVTISMLNANGQRILRRAKTFFLPGSPKMPTESEAAAAGAGSSAAAQTPAGTLGRDGERALWSFMDKQVDRAAAGKYTEEQMDAMKDSFERKSAFEREKADEAAKRQREAEVKAHEAELKMTQLNEEAQRKIEEATNGNSSLLGALIPTFANSANSQVQQMARMFEAREARLSAEHAKEIDQLSRIHESQVQQLQMLHQAELKRLEASAQSTQTLLQQQIQLLTMQLQVVTQECTQLRASYSQLQSEQLMALVKEKDPFENLHKAREMIEIAKDFGGGGGEGGVDLSEGAPDWMKLLHSLGTSIAPLATAVLQRGGDTAGGAPPMYQGAPPPGAVPAGMMVPQGGAPGASGGAPGGAMVPRPRAPRPQAPEERVRISRADAHEALTMLEAVMTSGTPAKDAADALCQQADGSLLRVLVRKPPERVISELDAAGLVQGNLSLETGKKYMTEFLVALRARLALVKDLG